MQRASPPPLLAPARNQDKDRRLLDLLRRMGRSSRVLVFVARKEACPTVAALLARPQAGPGRPAWSVGCAGSHSPSHSLPSMVGGVRSVGFSTVGQHTFASCINSPVTFPC